MQILSSSTIYSTRLSIYQVASTYGSTDSTSLDLDQDIVVPHLGERNFDDGIGFRFVVAVEGIC